MVGDFVINDMARFLAVRVRQVGGSRIGSGRVGDNFLLRKLVEIVGFVRIIRLGVN